MFFAKYHFNYTSNKLQDMYIMKMIYPIHVSDFLYEKFVKIY